jgi:hypothetical protein
MKIVFHTEQLDVRGTCVAIYDYAHYNETILGNKSVILTRVNNEKTEKIALSKFKNRFTVLLYANKEDIPTIINGYDIIYTIKYGTDDGFVFPGIKNVIHAVFDMSQPHGDVYAGISKTIADKYQKDLYVPHMISLKPSVNKENLREVLGIPEDANVFGRYGGLDCFNLQIAHNAIEKIVKEDKNTYFLFINTPFILDHPQVIHLSKITSEDEKNLFISTTDAYLEASTLGHSFGLAIGEFSVNNKPIIAYDGECWNKEHLRILGDKSILYNTEEELYNIFKTFDKTKFVNEDMNCYKEFSPENVMEQFKKVFIEG